MADELQQLIARVQQEAVETGEKQAATIIAQAKERAAALVKEAEDKAKALVEKAEKDASVFTDRSRRTLAQAARDLLIIVGHGIENILTDLAHEVSAESLTTETVKEMLIKIVDAYIATGGREQRIDVLLSADDQAKLVQYFKTKYQQDLVKGLTIHLDNNMVKGFKVSFAGERVYHDFSKEAIAEALTDFLRPHLAEIVHRVAHEHQVTSHST